MHIRKVRQDEWPALQILNNAVFVDNIQYDPDLVADWAFSDAGKKYFQELVVDPESVCFVAEDESGSLVGYLAASARNFSYRKSKYLEVDNMGVLPEYRSQGIGVQLMSACKEWAENNGYDKIFVNSYSKNAKAIAFYKKCGFAEIDVSLEMDV